MTTLLKAYEYSWMGSPIYIRLEQRGRFDEVWNPGESFAPKVKEEYKEIITLDSAISIITDQLTGKNIFRFDSAGLYYTIQQDNPRDSKTGKRKNEIWLFPEIIDYDYIEGRPAWVFYIDEENADGNPLSYSIHGTVILVDAITGEMNFFTGYGG
jgi:hypothetical protein